MAIFRREDGRKITFISVSGVFGKSSRIDRSLGVLIMSVL